jgi:hypothetical protein
MEERKKHRLRIYLRPNVLREVTIRAERTGQNISETIEQIIGEAHNAGNNTKAT